MQRRVRPGNLYRVACDRKEQIREYVVCYQQINPCGDIKHCAACAAMDVFRLTLKVWNGPTGAEYYAATLTAIMHYNLWNAEGTED